MAPRTLKRQAAPSAVTKESGKRAKRGAAAKDSDVVAKALREVSGEAGDARDMIATVLPSCLEVCKDERHEFQHQVVHMAEKAFAAAEAAMEASAKEGEMRVAAAPEEKARCEAAVAEAESALEAAKSQAKEKKAASSERTAAFKSAQTGLREAQAKQKEGDTILDAAASTKGRLESLVAEQLAPLKTDGGNKTAVGNVVKALKVAGLEAPLLEAATAALHRPPAQRGTFDQVVLEQLDGAIASQLAKLEEVLTTGVAAKEERAAAVAAAQAARDAAKAAQEAASISNQEALAAVAEAEVAFVEAREAMERFDRKLADASSELEGAKEQLMSFRTGPLATFRELRDKATLVAEAVEPVAQPDVLPEAEAPAEQPADLEAVLAPEPVGAETVAVA